MTPQYSFPPELGLHGGDSSGYVTVAREWVHPWFHAAGSHSMLVRPPDWVERSFSLHDPPEFLGSGSSNWEKPNCWFSPPGGSPQFKFTNHLKTKNRPFFNPFSWTVPVTWRSPERN